MLLDETGHQTPVRLQRLDGMHLIICHQERVPFDIGTKDGFEFSCNLFVIIGHAEITFWLGLRMIHYGKVVI
jgi:hypothetical protein